MFPYDHELERTLPNMNQNLGINDDDPNQNIPDPVDVHGQLLPDAPGEHQQRGQNPAPRPQENYRGYDNIADSDGPLVLPPLPPGHNFVVTSSLMQMLTARCLFSGLPSEDPHAHIAKVRAVCIQDDNNKALLDIIAGGSYGECPYAEIAEKIRENLPE